MSWHPHLYAIACRALQIDPAGISHDANLQEDTTQTISIDLAWECITFDFLPSHARRIIAFTHERIPCAWTIKQVMERGQTWEQWYAFIDKKLPLLDAPTIMEWLECRPTELAKRSQKRRSQDRKYDKMLSNLEPWKVKWPARFGIRRH